jgi:pimeloyl-ACP methyl ester carboxylesterase
LTGAFRRNDGAFRSRPAGGDGDVEAVLPRLEDVRGDLASVSIPVLTIHGDRDRILPYEATGRRLPALLNNAPSTLITGGPHAIIWTHANEVNQALPAFFGHLSRACTRHSRPENRSQRTDPPADPAGGRVIRPLWLPRRPCG